MKKLNLVLALLGVLTVQSTLGQTAAHLILSDSNPFPGEKISVTYNPSGTPLDGKTDPDAMVYFMYNKNYPVADMELNPEGKLLKGEFNIPNDAKAFFVKISKDDVIDDNNEQGYLYMVYNNDKKPVKGAYAAKAYVLIRKSKYA